MAGFHSACTSVCFVCLFVCFLREYSTAPGTGLLSSPLYCVCRNVTCDLWHSAWSFGRGLLLVSICVCMGEQAYICRNRSKSRCQRRERKASKLLTLLLRPKKTKEEKKTVDLNCGIKLCLLTKEFPEGLHLHS